MQMSFILHVNHTGLLCMVIAGFHDHAIKIKIENYSMNEVKKITRYRR